MDTWILGGIIITPTHIMKDHIIMIHRGKIEKIEPLYQVNGQTSGVWKIDAKGLYVLPGLIDIHTHGGAGSDTMDATPQAIDVMSGFFLEHGVTSYLATTITSSPEAIRRAIDNLNACRATLQKTAMLGAHIEGPYLSREYKGAQPEEWLRYPDPIEYRYWLNSGIIKLITVAPELPGVLDLIRQGVDEGVLFSVGHTNATYQQVVEAADVGLNQSTHTFNGMRGLNHHEPGAVGAVLSDDRIYCELIADGIHIHPAILRLLVKVKGIERTILVTDSIRATGLGDGEYRLGDHNVVVKDGVARTTLGGLAGSTLTLNQAIKNMMRFCGLTISQAVAMATLTPATALGISEHKGAIKPGMDADLVLADADLDVKMAFIHGENVFQKSI
jgi:N-acetylglucosamine-6-phosphate deacetylase